MPQPVRPRAERKSSRPTSIFDEAPARSGSGVCLPLGADIRIAARSATFRGAGINNGLTGTECGVSLLLPRLIGASRASEITLSGREVGADEAERIRMTTQNLDEALRARKAGRNPVYGD